MKKLFFALVFIFALGFINILFSEQPVPPDDGVGGGSRTGRWMISSYVWCGLDGMPGSTRGCFSCDCVSGGSSCIPGERWDCCSNGNC
jgi:hypothetical protein